MLGVWLDALDSWLDALWLGVLDCPLDSFDAGAGCSLDVLGCSLDALGCSLDVLGCSLDVLGCSVGTLGGSWLAALDVGSSLEAPGSSLNGSAGGWLDGAGSSLDMLGGWLDAGGSLDGSGAIFGLVSPLSVAGLAALTSAAPRSEGSSWRCRSISDLCGSGAEIAAQAEHGPHRAVLADASLAGDRDGQIEAIEQIFAAD